MPASFLCGGASSLLAARGKFFLLRGAKFWEHHVSQIEGMRLPRAEVHLAWKNKSAPGGWDSGA